MSKSIELTQSQIKAYENGATCFMFPINEDINYQIRSVSSDSVRFGRGLINNITLDSFIKSHFSILKGDKDIFIKEEFVGCDNIFYRAKDENGMNLDECWHPALQMTKEQSRYSLSECIDVRVVRTKEIAEKGYFDGADIKEDILKKLGLDWIGYFNRETYEEIGCDLFINMYNNQMQEQNINRTYEDNDYVCLCEFRR